MNRRISIGALLLLFLLLNYSTASAQQPVSGDKTFTVGGVSFTMKPVAGGTRYCRVSGRDCTAPGDRGSDLGLRLAL